MIFFIAQSGATDFFDVEGFARDTWNRKRTSDTLFSSRAQFILVCTDGGFVLTLFKQQAE